MDLETAARLGEHINSQSFDHVFTLTMLGDDEWTIDDDPQGLYCPDVEHSAERDVEIFDAGWEALTNMSGQHYYTGAVMHPSEYVGAGIARELARLAEDGPATFVITTVRDSEPEDGDDDVIGWCILHYVGV